MVQKLLVAFLVAIAAGYAAWSLAPRSLRATLAQRALAWCGQSQRCPAWLRARLASLANTAASSGCDTCGGGSARRVPNTDVPRKHP